MKNHYAIILIIIVSICSGKAQADTQSYNLLKGEWTLTKLICETDSGSNSLKPSLTVKKNGDWPITSVAFMDSIFRVSQHCFKCEMLDFNGYYSIQIQKNTLDSAFLNSIQIIDFHEPAISLNFNGQLMGLSTNTFSIKRPDGCTLYFEKE